LHAASKICNKWKGKVIRTFSKKDIKRAREFAYYLNSIIRERDFIAFNKPVTSQWERNALKDWLKERYAKKHVHIIAEQDRKIIGIADVRRRMGVIDHVTVMGISVRKEYRCIGIGSALMEECIKAARRMKAKILRLEVFSTNKRAIALYKRYGFKKVAAIPHQIQRKGKLISEIVMLKHIND
jgi:ribosomal protein S18 acetylase RimI-like enzyme